MCLRLMGISAYMFQARGGFVDFLCSFNLLKKKCVLRFKLKFIDPLWVINFMKPVP